MLETLSVIRTKYCQITCCPCHFVVLSTHWASFASKISWVGFFWAAHCLNSVITSSPFPYSIIELVFNNIPSNRNWLMQMGILRKIKSFAPFKIPWITNKIEECSNEKHLNYMLIHYKNARIGTWNNSEQGVSHNALQISEISICMYATVGWSDNTLAICSPFGNGDSASRTNLSGFDMLWSSYVIWRNFLPGTGFPNITWFRFSYQHLPCNTHSFFSMVIKSANTRTSRD